MIKYAFPAILPLLPSPLNCTLLQNLLLNWFFSKDRFPFFSFDGFWICLSKRISTAARFKLLTSTTAWVTARSLDPPVPHKFILWICLTTNAFQKQKVHSNGMKKYFRLTSRKNYQSYFHICSSKISSNKKVIYKQSPIFFIANLINSLVT